MKSTDPASLQNLNDIVLPAVTNWWPLAIGWYLLFGLLLVLAARFAYGALHRRINNRYRRAALHELQVLAAGIHADVNRDISLRQIPVLLKRTALSVYPRNQVASLSGKNWHDFLNSNTRNPLFTESTFITLEKISYTGGELGEIDSEAVTALLHASRQWLKQHQIASRPERGKEI